jgi:hypothetical protein
LNIERLKHPNSDHGRRAQVGLQDIFLDEADQVLDTRRAGIVPGLGYALRVDVDANTSGAVGPRGLDDVRPSPQPRS